MSLWKDGEERAWDGESGIDHPGTFERAETVDDGNVVGGTGACYRGGSEGVFRWWVEELCHRILKTGTKPWEVNMSET
jgi:hypothetical protein